MLHTTEEEERNQLRTLTMNPERYAQFCRLAVVALDPSMRVLTAWG